MTLPPIPAPRKFSFTQPPPRTIVPVSAKPNLLLHLPSRDISYTQPLMGVFTKYFATVRPLAKRLSTLTELCLEATRANSSFIATTDFATLRLVDPHLEGTTNDNTGTVLTFPHPQNAGIKFRIILLPPLVNQFSVNYGTFLIDHFCAKLAIGGILKKDTFRWDYITPATLNSIARRCNECSFLMAVDIETSRTDLKLTSVSYTLGFLEGNSVRTETYVIPCNAANYPFCIDAVRVMNNTTPPKVMQNGQYDATYFLRFNAPLHNWLYDTYTMAHATYAELPRTLSFISAFYLDNFRFWKDESGRNLYEYNAKDTHNTFWVWLAQILHAPDYALRNFQKKFPSVFPCLTCALDGMVVNRQTMQVLHASETRKKLDAQSRLGFLLSEPDINPGSSKQMLEMFATLGYQPTKKRDGGFSSDEKEMTRFKETSILYERIAELVLDYRGAAKAVSTYFEIELLEGYDRTTGLQLPPRLMYALDPSRTDTGRFASKESAFWCGTQIQNIPPYARVMCEADEGWIFGAVDKSQAESYCTGYISQDTNLIHTVTTSPDFHCQNASMFFGIPFAELYDVITKKKLNKGIRDIAKRVNHGANYNMGWQVLWETMGTKEVLHAKSLLRLPISWNIRKVCEYLLGCFDLAYPKIRKDWYNSIMVEVARTGMLVTPTGYTRRTFLKPSHKNKPDLNAAVAHKPQSFSSELVEQAFVTIYHELQLKKYAGKFRLKAQIHDEIIFIATPDVFEEALEDVAQMMVIPYMVHGRLMTIPSTKASGKLWSELKD